MLTPKQIVRAWRDEDYFLSLSDAEREALPANPAGLIELADEDLRLVSGGSDSTVEACSHPRTACVSKWYCSDPCTNDCTIEPC